MKILLAGAAGGIGRCLHQHFNREGHSVIAVDSAATSRLEGLINANLVDRETVLALVAKHKPDLVVHLAAMTDIGLCEQDLLASREANFTVTESIVAACERLSIRLIYFSTDYVFGHSKDRWETIDPPCPTTQYGRDKVASEILIQSVLGDYGIIRTAQVYGIDGDFIQLVSNSIMSDQKFRAFANLVNCPTWIEDLLKMLSKIIEGKHQGIFHCVGPEALSRYQFARVIAEEYSLEPTLIEPENLDFNSDVRPPMVWLNGAATYQRLGYYPGTLRQNLKTSRNV